MGRIQPTTTAAFRGYLQPREDREVFRMDELLAELIAHPGWELVMHMLGEGRENLIRGIVGAQIHEQAEYANRCGYIAGLEEATNAVAAVHAEAERRRQRIHEQAEAERLARERGSP